MLSNILVLQNIRTGLFVSPHLIKHNERIKMDNKDIDDNEFLDAFIKVKNKIDEKEREGISHPSYFEFLFLMAMYYFKFIFLYAKFYQIISSMTKCVFFCKFR